MVSTNAKILFLRVPSSFREFTIQSCSERCAIHASPSTKACRANVLLSQCLRKAWNTRSRGLNRYYLATEPSVFRGTIRYKSSSTLYPSSGIDDATAFDASATALVASASASSAASVAL